MSTLPPAAPEDRSSSNLKGRPQREPVFGARPAEKPETSWIAWGLAGVAVLLALGLILLLTHHKPGPPANTLLPLASYAGELPITDVTMSESTSLSGGKSTYIDGLIHNTGSKTLTAATVQVLFASYGGTMPQVETLPLSLIRTHEPYVDIQPVIAAPIAPGEDREFRLIFEDVTESWNQMPPEIHVVRVTIR
jgi:hypothetical protein